MQSSHLESYLALPPAGEGPGALVLHAWWGLSDAIKDFCDRLAEEGFVAYAPDLYHGKHAATIEAAEALSNQLDNESAKADTAAAVDYLRGRVTARDAGLGVVGFSLGAYFALQLSVAEPERVQAVALFYGTGDGDFSRAKASYLGHFAETDPYEPPEQVDWLERTLKSAGRPATFYRYPGTGHWFCEPDRPAAYNEAAARLAWERTLAFLKQALSPAG
jgi:carboxymethylenebutenolidase